MKEDFNFLTAIVAGFIIFFFISSLYTVMEDRRQARVERMFMRITDLVEQGKLTDEVAEKIQESLQ